MADYLLFWVRSIKDAFGIATELSGLFEIAFAAVVVFFVGRLPKVAKVLEKLGLHDDKRRLAFVFLGVLILYLPLVGPYHVFSETRKSLADVTSDLRKVEGELETQKQLVKRLETKLDETKPHLQGQIMEIGVGFTFNNPRLEAKFRGRTVIQVVARITNVGTPSIVEKVRLWVSAEKGERIPLEVTYLGEPFTPQMPHGGRFVRDASEELIQKAQTPVPNGGKIVGFIVAFAPAGITEDQLGRKENMLFLAFEDVTGTTYTNSFGMAYEVPASDVPPFSGSKRTLLPQ